MSVSELDDTFAFETSSPQSLRQRLSPHCDSHFSDIHHEQNATDEDYQESSDHHRRVSHTTSARLSSISSFPASVIVHTPPAFEPRTPSRSAYNYDESRTSPSPQRSPRVNSTGFRHPSSVRALQMRDDFGFSDLEPNTTPHRRNGSRMSHLSYRSSGSTQSSPGKRTSRSHNSSPQKFFSRSKPKTEFPLVLLHCTILPPALSQQAPQLSESVLEAVLPQPYARRWKSIQEKIVKNTEIRNRGILVPHPRDEYELLEEKLLESLELERPRLRDGHFLSADDATDSGFESGSSSERVDEHTNDQEEETRKISCPDCGVCFNTSTEADRKWDVKVYAANGLLNPGAWSAAWREMEKVDVEVGVWMPEDVRREVSARLDALVEQDKIEKRSRKRERWQADDERMREIYGVDNSRNEREDTARTQDDIDGLSEQKTTPRLDPSAQRKLSTSETTGHQSSIDPVTASTVPDLSITDMLTNYIRLLSKDPRNVAIFLLSSLVLFYGMTRSEAQVEPSHTSATVSSTSTTAVGFVRTESMPGHATTIIATETTTVIATMTSTVFESAVQSPTYVAPASLESSSDFDVTGQDDTAAQPDTPPQPLSFVDDFIHSSPPPSAPEVVNMDADLEHAQPTTNNLDVAHAQLNHKVTYHDAVDPDTFTYTYEEIL